MPVGTLVILQSTCSSDSVVPSIDNVFIDDIVKSHHRPCCRLRVHNFWSHETRLPVGTLDRLLAVLQSTYSPDSELQFLSYASGFLLEMTSRSPDYNREMFEQPLSQCKFQVCTILSIPQFYLVLEITLKKNVFLSAVFHLCTCITVCGAFSTPAVIL